jgi:hypothetical protein
MVGTLWLLFHATFQFGRILFVQPVEERARQSLEAELLAVARETDPV